MRRNVKHLNADPWDAFHVGGFMRPAVSKSGRWKVEVFTVTNRDAAVDQLRSQLNPQRGGRWTPPGTYAALKCKLEPGVHSEWSPERDGWMTVMSDTTDERDDHADVIEWATGRVLIHGLGLGCVLNAVLCKPDVTHVDVVEIDADVIELIAPYYERDSRVEIHNDDCVKKVWPRGTRWNYVWHDIWSHISYDNLLDDAEAEHGISYATLHRKFGGRCDQQGSWAWKNARWMREQERRFERGCSVWVFEYNRSGIEDRLDMLIEATRSPITPADLWMEFLEKSPHAPNMDSMMERAKEKFALNEAKALLRRG